MVSISLVYLLTMHVHAVTDNVGQAGWEEASLTATQVKKSRPPHLLLNRKLKEKLQPL